MYRAKAKEHFKEWYFYYTIFDTINRANALTVEYLEKMLGENDGNL